MVRYFIYHYDTWLQLQRGKRSKSCICQHLISCTVKEQPAVQHAYWTSLSQLAIKSGLHIRFTGVCSSMKAQPKTECWIPTLLLKLLNSIASPSLANIYSFRCGSVLFTVIFLCYKACLPKGRGFLQPDGVFWTFLPLLKWPELWPKSLHCSSFPYGLDLDE